MRAEAVAGNWVVIGLDGANLRMEGGALSGIPVSGLFFLHAHVQRDHRLRISFRSPDRANVRPFVCVGPFDRMLEVYDFLPETPETEAVNSIKVEILGAVHHVRQIELWCCWGWSAIAVCATCIPVRNDEPCGALRLQVLLDDGSAKVSLNGLFSDADMRTRRSEPESPVRSRRAAPEWEDEFDQESPDEDDDALAQPRAWDESPYLASESDSFH